jgi:hypothetical protein
MGKICFMINLNLVEKKTKKETNIDRDYSRILGVGVD